MSQSARPASDKTIGREKESNDSKAFKPATKESKGSLDVGNPDEKDSKDVKDVKGSGGDSKNKDVKDVKTDSKNSKDSKDIKGLEDESVREGPIRLVSKDLKTFILSRKFVIMSKLVKTSLENDQDAEEVPIPGVSSVALEYIVAYMTEHKGVHPEPIPQPLKSKVLKDACPYKWDADFIDKIGDNNRQLLYDVILAANYMDIQSLLYLGCAKVAALIRGEPIERLREILDPNKSENAKIAKPPLPSKEPEKPAVDSKEADKKTGEGREKMDVEKSDSSSSSSSSSSSKKTTVSASKPKTASG